MAQPVDPNDVLMTGGNSFIRLSADRGKTHSTRMNSEAMAVAAADIRRACA